MSFVDENVSRALETLTGNKVVAEELNIDESASKDLERFGLFNEPLQLQDHFLAVRNSLRKQYIDITGWEKKGMEISYKLSREGSKAALKTWINRENTFNGKYMKLPSLTNDDNLYGEAEGILINMQPFIVVRNTVETVLQGIDFELEQEEKHPFTKNLFDDLQYQLNGSKITIDDISHHSYRERYKFVRASEKAVLDFEYNAAGFFGRAVVLGNQTNSRILIEDLRNIINKFSNE
jgi:hypothetical protein